MVMTCLFFAANASLVKLITHIEAFNIALCRFVTGLIIIGLAAAFGLVKLKFNNRKLLLLRGALGGIGIFLTYLAIIKLGISKGMILVATYPIFAYIFSVILIKERPSATSAIAIVTAFAGIYLVMSGNNDASKLFGSFGIYELLAASVGVIGGLVIVIIRKLHQTDTSYSIYFSQCLVGLLIAVGPSQIWTYNFSGKDVIILLLVGITAMAGQLMMTQSYKYLPVKTGSTLMMLEPVFCYIAGVTIFGEFLSAGSVIGSILIIGSCIGVVLLDDRRKNQKA
ncbi:MAG: DMT family transporter [Sedimentisphaerales bacterium]|nr:DMT family transporter [Sedimentisphaerales bacterium]